MRRIQLNADGTGIIQRSSVTLNGERECILPSWLSGIGRWGGGGVVKSQGWGEGRDFCSRKIYGCVGAREGVALCGIGCCYC